MLFTFILEREKYQIKQKEAGIGPNSKKLQGQLCVGFIFASIQGYKQCDQMLEFKIVQLYLKVA